MSVPSSITNALLPISPKYWLSYMILLQEWQGMSWLRGAQYIHVRKKKLTTSYSRYDIASTNSSDHFRYVFSSTLPTLWELLCSVSLTVKKQSAHSKWFWINAHRHCFEWSDFVPKHRANFGRCTKRWVQSPVESITPCLREVYHVLCCIDDNAGGNCGHDCAGLFLW